jgi:hypothetical protein
MRNDARPIGEQSPPSPVGGDKDRQSQIVNKEAEEQPRDADADSLKTERTRKHQVQG